MISFKIVWHTHGLTSRIKEKTKNKRMFLSGHVQILLCKEQVNDHTSHMTEIRAKHEMDGEISPENRYPKIHAKSCLSNQNISPWPKLLASVCGWGGTRAHEPLNVAPTCPNTMTETRRPNHVTSSCRSSPPLFFVSSQPCDERHSQKQCPGPPQF